MLILGIDTSTKFLSLALSKSKKLLGELNLELGRELSEKLILTLRDFLKKHKFEINDIDGFCVGVGPGSFTGLRIGIAAIKGFALVLKTPVVGISTLDILAQGVASESACLICPIIDAKRNLVYSCIYRQTKDRRPKTEVKAKRISKYFLISISELLKKINSETIFVGDGIDLYKEIIRKRLGKRAIFASNEFWYPKAANLLELSYDKFKKRQTQDAHKLLPLYLYPKECQIRNSDTFGDKPRCLPRTECSARGVIGEGKP